MPIAPDVTVVIPTRNRWPLLEHALSCVERQQDVRVEAIIVDDASDVCAPASIGQRARLLRHDIRRGAAASRNLGLSIARGAWVAFLDDDDLWSPRKLCAQISAAEAGHAGAAFSAAFVIDEWIGETRLEVAPCTDDLAARLLVRDVIPGGCSNVVVRSDVVRRLGGFDEGLALLADWELWIRVALETSFASVDEPLVAYSSHFASMSASTDYDAWSEFAVVRERFGHIARERGVSCDEAAIWVQQANLHRRGGRRWGAAKAYLGCAAARRHPADILRAVGVLVGERALSVGRQLQARSQPGVQHPEWLISALQNQPA